jgi:hypothetical protein
MNLERRDFSWINAAVFQHTCYGIIKITETAD